MNEDQGGFPDRDQRGTVPDDVSSGIPRQDPGVSNETYTSGSIGGESDIEDIKSRVDTQRNIIEQNQRLRQEHNQRISILEEQYEALQQEIRGINEPMNSSDVEDIVKRVIGSKWGETKIRNEIFTLVINPLLVLFGSVLTIAGIGAIYTGSVIVGLLALIAPVILAYTMVFSN
ncbi:hypothetical protein [Halobaculum sp. EA56]|uniref:hypothetical protein n=1 Tax=Halobaculum sp. EA56 TaxID=3421648 RepID=UPI003EBD926A